MSLHPGAWLYRRSCAVSLRRRKATLSIVKSDVSPHRLRGSAMAKLMLVLSLSFFFLFPSAEPAGVSLIPQAAAQDALILKCRKAVFRKYGRREVKGERR